MSDIFSQQSANSECCGKPKQTSAGGNNSAETGIALLVTHSSGEQPVIPMLNRLMDLELPLSIALGRSSLPIREVLKMTPGSLIELDRNIGELVDLVVHGTTVAKGEVVSVKGNYGVRIKEIISRQDRLALQGQS